MIDNTIKLLDSLMGMNPRENLSVLLIEKMRGVKTSVDIINEKLSNNEQHGYSNNVVYKMIFSEFAIFLHILEKCFIDNFNEKTLNSVLKELILRADQSMLLTKKQYGDIINIPKDEIKKEAESFLNEILKKDLNYERASGLKDSERKQILN